MSYTSEFLYSLCRRVRVVRAGSWYRIQVSHVRGRWTTISRTQRIGCVPAIFTYELDHVTRYYPKFMFEE